MEELVIPILEDIDSSEYWGFNVKTLVAAATGFEGERIRIPINTYGGSVFEGFAIHAVIKSFDQETIADVLGYVMSIGTYITTAADKVTMPKGSYYMIHEPYNFISGTAEESKKNFEFLDGLANTIAKAYSEKVKNKAGFSVEEIREMMKEETWLTAEEAFEFGFVDEVRNEEAVFNKFDTSNYKNIPMKIKKILNKKKDTKNGTSLASVLNNGIESMISDDMTRAEIISGMADAAGIESGTVNQILNGDIDCPGWEDRIVPFANYLNISQQSLEDAGKTDGCPYGETEDKKVEDKKTTKDELTLAQKVTAKVKNIFVKEENKKVEGVEEVVVESVQAASEEIALNMASQLSERDAKISELQETVNQLIESNNALVEDSNEKTTQLEELNERAFNDGKKKSEKKSPSTINIIDNKTKPSPENKKKKKEDEDEKPLAGGIFMHTLKTGKKITVSSFKQLTNKEN